MGNPYLAAWWRRRRNRAATESWVTRAGRVVLPVVGLALLAVLLRPVLFGFLDAGPSAWGPGTHGAVLRLALVAVGVLSLDVYGALIRGPEREVLALHPVDPVAVVHAQLIRVGFVRLAVLAACAVVLLPVGLEASWGLWGLAVAVLVAVWMLALTGSAAVHLLAVSASESEQLAPILDLIRGHNPREQAAFIYAPGAVLLVVGLVVIQACGALASVWEGDRVQVVWIALPAVLAVLAYLPVAPLARRSWFRASAVLADIDARYGALADREDGLRVYLEWAVRFLPTAVGRYALKDLRHGWRARRTWITGAWLLGLAAGIAGWTADPAGPLRAAMVVVGGVALCATIGVLLERDEPWFLRRWLPTGGAPRWVARGAVLVAWTQATLPLALVSVGIRAGLSGAGLVLLAGELAVVLLVPAAMLCSVLRDRGLLVYGPVAAATGGALLAILAGGVG